METINNLILRDPNKCPDEKVLRSAFGENYKHYLSLLKLFDKHDLVYTWRYYNDGKAWLCKVQRKSRTIVWMSAWEGFMQATIYFPQKYSEKLNEIDITQSTREIIAKAKKVGKSTECIFEIKSSNILTDFEKLMLLKIKCR